MKRSVFILSAMSLLFAAQGSAVAQTATAAVTMQPVANPPEKPKKAKAHKAKAAKPAMKSDAAK